MNPYAKTERDRRRIDREHFIMRQWLFFKECRTWSFQDWDTRLKAEGLRAPSTYYLDAKADNRLIMELVRGS